MKIKLIYLTFLLLITALISIDKSHSFFMKQLKANISLTASSCFENCNNIYIENNDDPQLLFYANKSKNEVGFVLNNVSDYDSFDYEISYEHETEFGKLTEVVTGKIQNPSYNDIILEEWIPLGTESEGGTMVYHHGIDKADLKVELIKSGTVEKTLSDAIKLI